MPKIVRAVVQFGEPSYGKTTTPHRVGMIGPDCGHQFRVPVQETDERWRMIKAGAARLHVYGRVEYWDHFDLKTPHATRFALYLEDDVTKPFRAEGPYNDAD